MREFINISRLKVNKQHIIAFIAGILVVAIICGIAMLIMYEKGLFLDNTEMPGGVILQDFEVVSESDFDSVILQSSLPQLVYFVEEDQKYDIYDDLFVSINETWGSNAKVYYVNEASRGYLANIGLGFDDDPVYAIFYKGHIFDKKELKVNQTEIQTWIYDFVMNDIHSLAPELYLPIIYRMYPTGTIVKTEFADNDFNVSEIILTPVNHNLKASFICNGLKISKAEYENLFSSIGYTYGGFNNVFAVPDMTTQTPVNNLYYHILAYGQFAKKDNEYEAKVINSIKYVPKKVDYITEEMYISQIILARNIEEADFRNMLVPCDGRWLSKTDYPVLFFLLGDTFGSSTDTSFKIPDLSSSSPIDGATYYIVATGARFPE